MEVWEDMGIMLRKLVKAIENLKIQDEDDVDRGYGVVGGGSESARSSESESDTSNQRGSEENSKDGARQNRGTRY